ncbi:uncharacterized protein MYCGRDRAFT_33473 [Zymoseptoria tritici IPO323]|uniref:Acyl-coenzyme A diphosphatase SCS3 n=1 Tax=Zymoseptoria tritici (strain CBS 115943 / IPO323) TaxID=336722 RepID=F9WXZ1_ZYMTI|nr:uncharacterized protein MYCGRDRAFT_33473 [Zymoseptoria tritici IPO323]EGP91223.1 hypothetical protein MYCGRDRAFT_33473 [Zymoseptoria tritici IPO323]
MATRRTTKVEVPIPTTPNGNSNSNITLDQPPRNGSPYLPTSLETTLLAIYPVTLLMGSLFSTFRHADRANSYNADTQSYDPLNAPSYFAKKSNIFNVYFVKVGWLWTTLAFFLLILSHSSLGPPLRLQLTRRRWQATLRYTCATLIWIFVTQWFFGPAIIDRSFRWTGGQCQVIYGNSLADQKEREEMNDVREVFTHAACKATGGTWRGGHDISGHVFLLMLSSAMLWLEFLPAVLRMEGLTDARRIRTSDGAVRSAAVESDMKSDTSRELGIGVQVALGVAVLSWWMLLMTAAFFHTWFEKLTGSLVAFTTIYLVYFLPRAVPVLRQIIGMPGV